MGVSQLQKKTGFVLLSDQGQQAGKEYVTLVDKNGLIQVVPRERKRARSFAPLKLILLFVALMTLFKALAILNLGVTTYEEQLAALASGNAVERSGAVLLSIDPITQAIVQGVQPLIK